MEIKTLLKSAMKYVVNGNSKSNPRIRHCLEVLNILEECGVKNEFILAAAVLHRVFKDTDVTVDELRRLFGRITTNMVLETAETGKKHMVNNIGRKSLSVRLIKIADIILNCRYLNARPPKSWEQSNIDGYVIWSWHVCNNAIKAGGVPISLVRISDNIFRSLHIDYIPESALSQYYLDNDNEK